MSQCLFRRKNTMTDIRHPWRYLQQELLHRGRTQKDFAYLLGKKGSEVNELIKGKRNITVQWDILLSKLFDDPEKKWIHLQVEYDYHKSRTSVEEQKIQELLSRKHAHGQVQIPWEIQLPITSEKEERIPEPQEPKEVQSETKSSPEISKPTSDVHKKHEIFKNF